MTSDGEPKADANEASFQQPERSAPDGTSTTAETPNDGAAIAEDILDDAAVAGSTETAERVATSSAQSEVFDRLHWSTVVLPVAQNCMRMLFFALAATFFANAIGVLIGAACYVGITFISYTIRFLTVRFMTTNDELVIRSGLIEKNERKIPYSRVQETRLHQGILHRLFGLVRLEIKTAGSDQQEAVLDVITKQQAERLRLAVDGRHFETRDEESSSIAEPQESGFRTHVPLRTLALGGLTSNIVASIGGMIGILFYFQGAAWFGDRWTKIDAQIEERINERVNDRMPWSDLESKLPDYAPINYAVDFYFEETLGKGLVLALFGLVVSVTVYVVRYYGFTLTRTGRLLGSSYGLLTLQEGTLSRDRIQTLKIEEGLLRRPFGLASVRVDSAGDQHEVDEAKNRATLVPVAKKASIFEVARQAIPGLDDLEPEWRRISPIAIMRGARKGWLVVLLCMIQTWFLAGWFTLAWLPAFALVYFLNLRWYQNTGYWQGDDHFLSRRGWLNRSTTCLPIKNIQNITLRQNFFDRRLGLASLSIDTAGQSNTGGGPVIRHLPLVEAQRMQDELAMIVGSTQSAW